VTMNTDSDLNADLEWKFSHAPVDYEDALTFMEERAAAIYSGTQPECIWMLEHPALYTAGTSADISELVSPDRFPVYETGRGGRYTYHGPGQRIAYVMLNLDKRGRDIRAFVANLEEWVIKTLAQFNVTGERREGRVGIWVDRARYDNHPDREDKIAAIGVRVRRWVTFHGLSINVEPDLEHFSGIIPCGIEEHGITSLVDLGVPATVQDVDNALIATFEDVFKP
jgi:lipoyl(octanoyl) transferase